MDTDSVFQLRDFGPPTQRPRQKSTLQRPNILPPPRIRILSFSCRVISCPCFSASRTGTSLSRTRFAPFFFSRYRLIMCRTIPEAVTIAFWKKKRKEREKSVGSSGRMYNAKWITCWLLHNARFFSPLLKGLVPILCSPIRGRSPRPELRWCLVWAANLSTFRSSSREFELWFFLVCCLSFFLWFAHAEMSNDVLVMIFIARDHDYFFFSHLGRNLLLLYQPPLSALTFLGISSFLELTAGMM